MTKLTLISHKLCPYVQRAVIALAEKGVPFERIDVDLANKPDWFLTVSPLGKTPVLLVGDTAIFESAVILEYLEDTQAPAAASGRSAGARRASRLDRVRLGDPERHRRSLRRRRTQAAFAAKVAALRAKFARARETAERPMVRRRALQPRRCGVRSGVPLFRCVRPHRRFRHPFRLAESRGMAPCARVPRERCRPRSRPNTLPCCGTSSVHAARTCRG